MRLAVIGTFHRRYEHTLPLLRRVLEESTLTPNEFFIMCEDEADTTTARDARMAVKIPTHCQTYVVHHPTPRNADNKYRVIPYSHKINYALERTEADLIVYLDNNSMPATEKYAEMVAELIRHPEYGAVYCSQRRTGVQNIINVATMRIDDAWCVLNYTQVMHRMTTARWPEDMKLANPDLADAEFWRELHKSLGPFYPAGGTKILDEHFIGSVAAAGLED